jgi:hypothetical protein
MKISAVCFARSYSRQGLDIVLDRCTITSAGSGALAEGLGRYQGPTRLDYYDIDNLVLTDGLRGNSLLKILKLRISGNLEVGNREFLPITGAIEKTKASLN